MKILEGDLSSMHKLETWYKDRVTHTLYLRAFDKFLKKHFKNQSNIVGAEIGVLGGCHADAMLHMVDNISKLMLIDPYINYEGYENNYVDHGLNNFYIDAKKRLRWASGRTTFVPEKFQDALEYIPEELDFAYYDIGIQGEAPILEEFFRLYYPLIKPGGVIGGYNFDANHLDVPDVVMKFSKDNNPALGGIDKDWWMIKNPELMK